MNKSNWWKIWLLSWLPDLAISWAAMKLTDDKSATFWYWLAGLTIIQLLLIIKQVLSGSLIFRLHGKKYLQNTIVDLFFKNQFPPPAQTELFDEYMHRLTVDESVSMSVRLSAQATWSYFGAIKEQGFFIALRTDSACNDAVIKYRAVCI